MNRLYFHNQQHYGDCLISLHFLIGLSQVNNIECEFYCNPSYHSQLQELIPENVSAFLSNSINQNSIDLWGAKLLHKVQEKYKDKYPLYCDNQPQYQDIFKLCFEMWKCLSKDLELICPFNNKSQIMFDEHPINIVVNKKYDWLLVNSYCLSGQVRYSQKEQDNIFLEIINKLKEKNKTFITTHKLKDYPSTQDKNLSLVQIAQLSKNCQVIMGVPTSPFWISINKWSFENCDKFINLTHDSCTYDLDNKFITVNCLDDVLTCI